MAERSRSQRAAEPVSLLDGISFHLQRGEIFGLVGESGCGKTLSVLAVNGLLPEGVRKTGGSIRFEGREAGDPAGEEARSLRGRRIGMVFQEPGQALDPLMRIQAQAQECFLCHGLPPDTARILETFGRVGFPDPERVLRSFPHELSGGMQQRAVIAMALLLKPALLIADEPTTALDVTVQAQILELLTGLTRDFQVSVLLITHNLGLVAQYAGRVAVMYAGRIVEEGPVASVLPAPLHPYTEGLLRAVPDLERGSGELVPIPGSVPRPEAHGAGCRFRDRCLLATAECAAQTPPLRPLGPERKLACFHRGGEP